jgi:hypothetical protein
MISIEEPERAVFFDGDINRPELLSATQANTELFDPSTINRPATTPEAELCDLNTSRHGASYSARDFGTSPAQQALQCYRPIMLTMVALHLEQSGATGIPWEDLINRNCAP